MFHDDAGWYINCVINNQTVRFKVDTGASVSAVPIGIICMTDLQPTSTRLKSAGGQTLTTLGSAQTSISVGDKRISETLFVVENLAQPLLGKPAIEKLSLIQFTEEVVMSQPWRETYSQLFQGLGCFEAKCTIRTKSSVEPFALAVPRKVPAARQEAFKEELDRMVSLGVIERIERPTDWCSPCLVVVKKSGGIRFCIDYTALNRAVRREYHPLPATDEVLSQLKDAKVFSKLDANSGYWQMELSEDSKDLTTFITPFGRFRCHRLPFGISSAPEIFQREMQKVLLGTEGVLCMMDDILVYGGDKAVHDHRLAVVLEKLTKAKLTLNSKKCQFEVATVTFLGHVISKQGISADPEKISAIKDFPAPNTVAELRRFMGMVNYLGKFSARLTDSTPTLRLLMNKTSDWTWGDEARKEFQEVKRIMTSTGVLVPYDLSAKTRLSTDASSYGLGAVVLQHVEGHWKPVAYASRTMSPAEKNYAQIEKEALAICWAAEKFYYYLSGRMFEVETDHKPLLSVLGVKELSKLPLRLQRFRLRMMSFDYTVAFTPGSKLVLADALSRISIDGIHAAVAVDQLESSVGRGTLFESLPLSESRLKELQRSTIQDEVGRLLFKFSTSSWPDKKSLPEIMKPFVSNKASFTVLEGLVFMDNRIYVPVSERRSVLSKVHAGHLGETKCIRRATEVVWWPGITTEIRQMVKSCQTCLEYRRVPREPLIATSLPHHPWDKLGIDFFQWKGDQYLVMVDYYSRYIVCEKMLRTTSAATMAVMEKWLFAFGIPQTIVSDNGPQLVSAEFQQFLRTWDVEHVTSAPHYAQSNGEVERAVQTVKGLLNKNKNLNMALCMYRDSPLANGYSPAQLLFGRSLNSMGFSSHRSVDREAVKQFEEKSNTAQAQYYNKRHRAKDRGPALAPGQQVKVTTEGSNRPGVVTNCNGREVMVDVGNTLLRRNRSQVVPRDTTEQEASSTMPVGTTDNNSSPKRSPDANSSGSMTPATPVGIQDLPSRAPARQETRLPPVYTTRSGRTVKPPDRLDL